MHFSTPFRSEKTALHVICTLLLVMLTACVVEHASAQTVRVPTPVGEEVAKNQTQTDTSSEEELTGLARAWKNSISVWRYRLTTVDGNDITVGKIVISFLLLILGVWISRVLSSVIGRRVLPRFGMNAHAAAVVRSLTFYVLLIVFTIFALSLANVPLTAFTLLGGAVALGVGFGSQNIVNNFLSGLVLIAERPIRVGDLVQIGTLYGSVEQIGTRSTRVRTGENIEIIVPNSSFLEQNVINWTLTEPRVRVSVSVGVMYGSPTRDVSRLLLKASEEHGRILKTPAPIVLFTEFGDNALIFEVHFWIEMRRIMDRRMTESDIRYRIDSLFREAGITIAFPQRDLHIDSSKPIEVRMVKPLDDETHPTEADE